MEISYSAIESKWKAYWQEKNINRVDLDTSKPKFYVLDMFPYPSGSGLHVGHPLGYIASDIFSRYKKMKGYNVLHPMGFDAFGLPAEQYAIQTGVHPAVSTEENIAMYRKQLDNIGFNYDWDRSVNTSKPDYYKWTQWIFIQLFDHYYDVQENKAKPIQQLIDHLHANGTDNCTAYADEMPSFSAEVWQAMSDKDQADILMNFRLAYRKISFVNWCEELGTVLANDEVKDGLSERGGFPVERRAMKQWSLRITAYAERLLTGLKSLDWSDSLKAMQRNWIGKSTGATVFFSIKGHNEQLEIFTTRPDTIFGSTFMVIAPELDIVQQLTTPEQKEAIEAYIKEVSTKSERERMADVKKVTGCFTGSYAIHPFTGEDIPIWIADYVLKDYGSGAIMAVPSDDARDRLFAETFDLPIIEVVDQSQYPNAEVGAKIGVMQHSDFLNGLEVKTAISKAIEAIEAKGIGFKKVNYKLRDANFSRQRYWGEPFPMVYKDDIPHPLQASELPLALPDLSNFKPAAGGKSPLARLEDWVAINGGLRETDTMPGFAGSSWYFLRYMDAKNDQAFASKEALDYWQNVDLYVGGTEHAVGHLMYARFWHKFLFDLEYLPTDEPFKRLINQGMIQGVIEYLYLKKDSEASKTFVSAELVDDPEAYAKIPVHIDFVRAYGTDQSHLDAAGIQSFVQWRPDYSQAIFIDKNGEHTAGDNDIHFETVSEVGKMSKRYFNVVNPDDVVAKYGADCFRMYEMFLGPIEQSKPWDTKGIDGVAKFIRKLWGLFYDDNGQSIIDQDAPSKAELKALHTAIKKISVDIDKFSFNTCISAFMVLVNDLRKEKCSKAAILQDVVALLAPFAPFITEELWEALGNKTSVHLAAFPEFDASALVEDEVTYPVCFNGKKKFLVQVSASLDKAKIEEMVPNFEQLDKYLDGKTIKKIIVVPGRIINIIV